MIFETGTVYAISVSIPWIKIILSVLVATLGIWISLRRRNKISKRGETLVDRLPGPKALPLLGNALDLRVENEDFMDLLGDLCRKWGGIFRVWYFNNPWVMVTSVDDVQKLYSSPSAKNLSDKTEEIEITKQVVGSGLYTRDANIYHERRKLLNPGFGISLIRKGIPKVNLHSARLIKTFKKFSETGESVNIYPILISSSIRLIWDSLFAKTFEDDAPDVSNYAKAMFAISYYHTRRVFKPWLRPDVVFNLTEGSKLAQEGIQFLNDFARKAVNERRLVWQKKSGLFLKSSVIESDTTENNEKDEDWACYVDFLFEQQEKGLLTEKDVEEEFSVFTVGAKVVAELDDVFGRGFDASSFEVTMGQVKQLKHLDFCMKEVLRLYPPVPVSGKKNNEDIQLDDGRVIPAGVQLYVSMHCIHRDPKYFPDPEAFIPERFSPDSKHYREKGSYAFIPFSVLPRSCPGQNYGMVNIKVVLAYLLKAYEWTTVTPRDKLKMSYQYTSHPKNSILTIKPRL